MALSPSARHALPIGACQRDGPPSGSSAADDLGAIMARRARDLTPTDGRLPESLLLPPFPLGVGGAARFRRYLIIGPSLWWDDRVILQYEQAWADNHDDLPARLFIAVGSREQASGGGWKNEGFSDEAIAAVRQVDNCRELCARLGARQYPDLSLECVVFDGEYHLTVGAAAITRGLISLFSAQRPTSPRVSTAPTVGAT